MTEFRDQGNEALSGNVIEKVNKALDEYLAANKDDVSKIDQLGLSQALVKGGFIEMVTQGYRGEKIQLSTTSGGLFEISTGDTLGVDATESPSGTRLRQPSSMATMREVTGKILKQIQAEGKVGVIKFIHGPK